MKITHAEFVTSAFRPSDYPPEQLPEAAFAGKSNVGKSSLINVLLNRKNLARTSSTPGRTQSLNFFNINQRFMFVDFPGYGFAKVPLSIRKQWKPMVETYLTTRTSLKVTVVIIDARREPSEQDRELVDWLKHYAVPFLVVLTKVDKISRAQRSQASARIRHVFNLAHDQIIMFSAVTGEGKEALWKRLLVNLTP